MKSEQIWYECIAVTNYGADTVYALIHNRVGADAPEVNLHIAQEVGIPYTLAVSAQELSPASVRPAAGQCCRVLFAVHDDDRHELLKPILILPVD